MLNTQTILVIHKFHANEIKSITNDLIHWKEENLVIHMIACHDKIIYDNNIKNISFFLGFDWLCKAWWYTFSAKKEVFY